LRARNVFDEVVDIGLAKKVYDKLFPAKLAYNYPRRLRVGETYRQLLRITADQAVELLKDFGGPGEIKQENLSANSRVRVKLVGSQDALLCFR
jgi:hypothetical protein